LSHGQAVLHRHRQEICLPHLSEPHHAPEGTSAAMTDSNTTIQAASNGGDTAEKSTPAQREHGRNRLREQECYHLTSLIEDCLSEAEHLVKKVHNKVYNRVLDYDGSKGTQPLDRAEARQLFEEAYDCASLALTYIYSASTHLRDEESAPPEPGWL